MTGGTKLKNNESRHSTERGCRVYGSRQQIQVCSRSDSGLFTPGVSSETGYWLDGRGVGVLAPVGARMFSPLRVVRNSSGLIKPPINAVKGAI
jgi:hypothetical protein